MMKRITACVLALSLGMAGCSRQEDQPTAATKAAAEIVDTRPSPDDLLQKKDQESLEAWTERMKKTNAEWDANFTELCGKLGDDTFKGKIIRFGGRITDQTPGRWTVETRAGVTATVKITGKEPYSDARKEELSGSSIIGYVAASDKTGKSVTVENVSMIHVWGPAKPTGN